MTEAPHTRRSLLVRIRDPRDEPAWSEFTAIYEPLVYSLARARGLQDADARDLCQEVFRAVAGAIERWDPDPARGTFRGWLFQIARNLLINFLVQQRRHVRGSGDTDLHALLAKQPAPTGEDSALFDLEYKRRVFRWAAESVQTEFAPSTWQAFWRTAVEGAPVPQVAADLGMSAGAVYIARSRVLARLRERVEVVTGRSCPNVLE
jgi:RNA polymerase sigma-70 factor (ECF subfamily)